MIENPLANAKAMGNLPDVPLKDIASGAIEPTDAKVLALGTELTEPRCGHPDFWDVELAQTEPGKIAEALQCDGAISAAHLHDEGYIPPSKAIHEMHARWYSHVCSRAEQMRGGTPEEATGRGSIPPGCNSQYPDHHSMTVYVRASTIPSHMQRRPTDAELLGISQARVWGEGDPSWDQFRPWTPDECRQKFGAKSIFEIAYELAAEAARRHGNAWIRVDDLEAAYVDIAYQFIAGGTIGFAYFNNRTCRDRVRHRLDNSWRPSNPIHRKAGLISHEGGHNENLEHTFSGQDRHRSVMSYRPALPFEGFRTGRSPFTVAYGRDASWSVLERFFGGQYVPKIGQPPTPPPIPPGPGLPLEARVVLVENQVMFLSERVSRLETTRG